MRRIPATLVRPADLRQSERRVTDDELVAIRGALRDGGRFAFETRHPQARAWEGWNPSNTSTVVGPLTDISGEIVTTRRAQYLGT